MATQGRGLGLQIYEDLERDDKVYASMQTRKNAVSGKEWQINPASDESQDVLIADFVRGSLGSIPLGNIIKSLLDSRLKGFAVSEVMWGLSETGSVIIKEIIGRDQRRFTFDLDRNLRLRTMKNLIEGEEVQDKKFIVLSFGSKTGNPFGSGLGARLYWPVWFKKNGVKFWSIFLDKFGSPTAIGKHPATASQPQIDDLLEVIGAIQNESALAIPENMVVELLEANRAGSTDSYEKYMAYWDKAISIAVLGQSLTTDVGSSGSRALGDVHNEVRLDLVKDDACDIAEVFNSDLIPWLVDFNFPNVKAYPKFKIRHEPEQDLKALAERDVMLIDRGLDVGEQYFYDTYSIPKPEKGEALVVKANPEKNNPKNDLIPSEFARELDQQVDSLDPFVDRAMSEADMDSMIDPIRALVEKAESLEELKDMILSEFKDVDAVRLGDLLQQALTTSNLLGRFEASE